MNKILLSILFILSFTSFSYADIYVISDKDGNIYTISEKNDTVVPNGYSIDILDMDMADIALSRPIDEYKLKNGKFKVDAQAVKAKEDAQLDADTKRLEKKAKRKAAKDKLKTLGLDESDIEALFGKE